MSIKNWLVAMLVVGLLVLPRLAEACGVWHMTDAERKVDIEWLINAGRVNRPNPKYRPDSDDNRTITIASIYLDTENKAGMRVVRDNKVVFDVAGGKLRKLGKVIGSIDAATNAIKIGGKTFTVEWGDKGTEHDMPAWKLTVKRGDTVVITADHASALCAGAAALAKTGKMMPDDDQLAEIRTRIAFYLAWRELGDK